MVIVHFFDPLGLVSPDTNSAKLFLQQLWQEHLEWDTTLDPSCAVNQPQLLLT